MEEIVGYCTLCRSRCGSVNQVKAGRLVQVSPLPGHPTGGALCAKGRAAPELLASPKRLGRPLKRTRPRDAADPGWIEISWDQALDEIATKLGAIRSTDGPEAVAFGITTPSGTPMVDSFEWVERFTRVFGSPNVIYAVEVCGWHKDYAHELTFGRGIGFPDLEHANTIVMWGHNPARTWLAQASRIAEARKRGAQLVVIDPKADGTGQQADLWLGIRPGADACLAMGAIRHLINTESYDAEFAKQWTNLPMLVDVDTGKLLRARDIWSDGAADSFVVVDIDGQARAYPTSRPLDNPETVRLRGELDLSGEDGRLRRCATVLDLLAIEAERYTVEHVAQTTWLAPDLVNRFNALFMDSPKLAYHAWTGVGQHTNATMTERAIGTLFALTGACDRLGGNLWSVAPPTRVVNNCSLLSPEQRGKALGLAELPLGPPARGWITARDFSRAVMEGLPYRVRALMSFGTNFVVSQGDSTRNLQALQSLEFHVHVDMFMNPSAQNADIVLPANMPWERDALKIGFEITQAAVEFVQFRPQMVAAFGESRSDYDIVFALAKRLDLKDRLLQGDIQTGWNHQLAPLGITIDDLRKQPQGMSFPQPFTYRKYAQTGPSGEVSGFKTPCGRVEIYSETLLKLGHAPLPTHIEPALSPLAPDADTRYPLVLTTAKSGWFVHSSHRHVASLRKKSPDPCVYMSSQAAIDRGISNGDWVNIDTPYGQAQLRAKIDEKLEARVVIAEFGWWEDCTPLGRPGSAPTEFGSANINNVLRDIDRDPISGSVPLRANLCQLTRNATRSVGLWDGLRPFSIISKILEPGEVMTMELAPVDQGPLPSFLPGQHITVSSTEHALLRCYSLTGPHQQPNTLRIGVKLTRPPMGSADIPAGKMSSYLHGLELGAIVNVEAPNGTFTPALSSSRPLILMANGVGITPFLGYLESLALTKDAAYSAPVHVVYVCRDGASHTYAKTLKRLTKNLPQVEIHTYYSNPSVEDRCPQDFTHSGRPGADGIAQTIIDQQPLVYLCGSSTFLRDMRAALITRGIPDFDIFSEAFSSRVDVPETLDTQIVVLANGTVNFVWTPESGSLLDAAEAAGLQLPNGCRVGQCESCAIQILSGSVAHLSPYDGPADQCLMCQAVPLSRLELNTK